jgi:hypothetical protein
MPKAAAAGEAAGGVAGAGVRSQQPYQNGPPKKGLELEKEMDDIESEIGKLDKLFDTIQSSTMQRTATEEDKKERVQRLSIGILELNNRLFLEGMTDRGGKLKQRINNLKEQLSHLTGIRFEHVDPKYETTLAAARKVLEVWNELGTSEFSKLYKPDQDKLELIIQHYLPEEATIFLQSLYPRLPDTFREEKVSKILSANISFFIANARVDLTRTLGVDPQGNLRCEDLAYYSEGDRNSNKLKIIITAIRSSIKSSNTKLNFADTFSSIMGTAADHPYTLFKIIAGSATVVAAASSMAPVATGVVVAAGDTFAAAAANPHILAAIKTMITHPVTTGAGIYYAVENAKGLLTSLNTQFGIDDPARREIQSLFNKIDSDWVRYEQARFVGPVPDSILNFYDAYLTLFSFVKKICWNEAHNISKFTKTVFKVPKVFSEFCCKAVRVIGDRFNQFERWMRPAGEQTKQRMHLYHDTFRRMVPRELEGTPELRDAFASLAESDDRPILFEVSLERWMGMDALQFPENYVPMSDTLEEVRGDGSPPRDHKDLDEEIGALPVNEADTRVVSGERDEFMGLVPVELPKNAGQGPSLHTTLSGIRRGEFKANEGGKRTRRRKATTKKQKSKKNKRQSRRKSRRSSSRKAGRK